MSSPHRFARESRPLLRLAGPIILSQVAQVAMGLVDTVMAGQAGAQELAVVGLGVALWIPVFVCLMSVVQSLSTVVAHHFGANDAAAVARDSREGIWMAAVVGLLPLLLAPWAPDLLRAAGIAPGLAARSGVFLWGIGLGMPAAMVYRAIAFYSASIGQTRPIVAISFAGLAVNAALNWGLIHGHAGLPAMGGAGCGWATGIGMWLSLFALAAWTARAPVYRPWFLWRAWARPRWEAQWRLLRIGLPMGTAALAEVTAFSSVAVLVGRFGDVQIAAHQIALNFSALVFMLPMGVASAMTIRIGHAIGAGDARGARDVAWTGMAIGVAIALAAIGPIIVLRHQVAAVYSSDPAVRALASDLFLFAAFWIVFDATQVCAIGALRGYKVTLMPMVLALVAFWLLGIPVGTWLGYQGLPGSAPLEVYGFWVGLVVGLVTLSIGATLGLWRVADATLRRGVPASN